MNPQAVNEPGFDVFTANKRSVLYLTHGASGRRVAFVAIGAMLVGAIRWTGGKQAGAAVRRGDELGYFAYGGSTVVCLFPPGLVTFDEDLVRNSQGTPGTHGEPVETYMKVRSRVWFGVRGERLIGLRRLGGRWRRRTCEGRARPARKKLECKYTLECCTNSECWRILSWRLDTQTHVTSLLDDDYGHIFTINRKNDANRALSIQTVLGLSIRAFDASNKRGARPYVAQTPSHGSTAGAYGRRHLPCISDCTPSFTPRWPKQLPEESDITQLTGTGSLDCSGKASRLIISCQSVCIDPFLGLATRTEVQHPESHMAVRACGGKAEVGRYGHWEGG